MGGCRGAVGIGTALQRLIRPSEKTNKTGTFHMFRFFIFQTAYCKVKPALNSSFDTPITKRLPMLSSNSYAPSMLPQGVLICEPLFYFISIRIIPACPPYFCKGSKHLKRITRSNKTGPRPSRSSQPQSNHQA